jgi:hypothetical protein
MASTFSPFAPGSREAMTVFFDVVVVPAEVFAMPA